MDNSSNDGFTVTSARNAEETDTEIRFEIVSFQNKKKLRSHTYKHFFNENEFVNAWSKFTTKTLADISQARKYLDQIQCPAAYNKSKACENDCPSYGRCTYVIDDFEKEYSNCIEQIVNNSVETPLFSVFDSNRMSGQKLLVFLSKHTVIAQAAAISGNKFNLSTCYASNMQNESFLEFRDKNVKKIGNDALKGSTTWYSMNSWGLAKKKMTNSKIEKIRQQPYKRGGFTNYRQYLNEVCD